MGLVLCRGVYVWVWYCDQVYERWSGTVSSCISVDLVQYPYVCGSGMCPGV